MKSGLDFGELYLTADLFNTRIAAELYESLPCEISLVSWGRELYGPIDLDLGEEQPVSIIPPGGLDYTRKGNFFCIFYGQDPAWDVEHIGRISDEWQALLTMKHLSRVVLDRVIEKY